MSDSSEESSLLNALAAELPTASGDSLRAARDLVRQARDMEREADDLEQRASELRGRVRTIKTQRLVELMGQVGIKTLTLAAEGNHAAFVAKLKPFYEGNIAADWEPERRMAAFDWLEANGHGDIIKNVITVSLPRDSQEDAEAVRTALDILEIPYTEAKSVHHGTLKSWLREQTEKYHRALPLSVLGASIGQVVEIKSAKED